MLNADAALARPTQPGPAPPGERLPPQINEGVPFCAPIHGPHSEPMVAKTYAARRTAAAVAALSAPFKPAGISKMEGLFLRLAHRL